MEEFGRQSALAIRRFAAFSAVTGVFFSLNRAINSGLKSFIEFDKELVRLQQVTGQSADGLKGLQDEITRLSTGLGVSSDSLIQVSSTLAQAGLSARETEQALKALALTELAPSFDDINQTVEGSIALMRQFGIAAKDLEKALGSVNSVAAAFAVESSDIIAAIQRTGGVFATASKGVSEGADALNEFIAVFTSVRATTRESAETIATGLRTIFTRIQRQGTIEALKEFGVTLTDAEGKFVGAYKAVQLLSEGLSSIDPRDIRFSQIVEELGGFRQIGKVIPLIQQFATAQDALRVAQAGQGSLAADAAKAQLSLANQIAKVREEFLTLIRSLGQSDTFQTLARGALTFASGLIKITDAVKGVLPSLAILAAGASFRGLSQFTSGFIGGLKKVPKGGPGAQQPESVAGSIGRNIGSSLVGAKTEQVSRDLDQN
ncbi:MAG: phage tail tape measure protein, partial [Alphaproteobacteria bacterium]|nr:phage tail tape measure protein [Alphaproteobacteria bacterium]